MVLITITQMNCLHCALFGKDNCSGRGSDSLKHPDTHYCLRIFEGDNYTGEEFDHKKHLPEWDAISRMCLEVAEREREKEQEKLNNKVKNKGETYAKDT